MSKVAILTRPYDDAVEETNRFAEIIGALESHQLSVSVVHYAEEDTDEVRRELLNKDAVLVWVDPISGGRNRNALDSLLKEVATAGVWVSTHPDVIQKMGTKDVLIPTRSLSWGSQCYRYDSPLHLVEGLSARLPAGTRVLKQHRGNGGNGTWRVESVPPWQPVTLETPVRVLHAARSSEIEELTLREFILRCEPYFQGGGCIIDQPYQARLKDGMIRCYLVGDRVAGFGFQHVTALMQLPSRTTRVPAPSPRLYYGPKQPEFQRIKNLLEGGWLQELLDVTSVSKGDLPALWDADFLFGPKDAAGEDSYVLCEINVSSVSPFPHEATEVLAEYVSQRIQARSKA